MSVGAMEVRVVGSPGARVGDISEPPGMDARNSGPLEQQ